MLKGLYTAASGMLANTTSVDVLANNLANVNTVGYKATKLNYQTFPEMLIRKMDTQGSQEIGGLMTGGQVFETFTNFSAGAFHETGSPFDLAIHGNAFFAVKAANGPEYLTRAGDFKVNEQGFITTQNGEYLQGPKGNIQLQMADGPFTINPHGQILGKNGMVGQITLRQYTNNQTLEKVGDNLYQSTAASRVAPTTASIQQGALENSNVNPVSELVNNIQGLRLYEALQKNMHMHNDTLGKAVNEVGRYR